MKALLFIILLTACAASPTVDPIVCTWNVTHNTDTWTWTLDTDGKLWEPGGCGEWYYAGKNLIKHTYLRIVSTGR